MANSQSTSSTIVNDAVTLAEPDPGHWMLTFGPRNLPETVTEVFSQHGRKNSPHSWSTVLDNRVSSLDRAKSRRLLFEPGAETLVVRSTDNASINLVQDQISLFCDDLDLLELQLLKLEIVTSF